jgi:hypothetical protein
LGEAGKKGNRFGKERRVLLEQADHFGTVAVIEIAEVSGERGSGEDVIAPGAN